VISKVDIIDVMSISVFWSLKGKMGKKREIIKGFPESAERSQKRPQVACLAISSHL